MTFKQWLRKAFGPWVQNSRASRRGKSRQPLRHRYVPMAEHLEDRLATIACHSVIRAHRKLEPHEMRALLEALDQSDFATQCPHGRPVLIEWSQAELDRLFKRIV